MTSTTLRTILLLPLAACIVDYDLAKVDASLAEVSEEVAPEPPDLTDETPPDAPTDVAEPDDPAPVDDCDNTSASIYAIARDGRELYLFDPGTSAFDYLGDLDCSVWGSPNSMGVARDGVAYVRWSDDTVYEVHLPTLQCRESDYQPNTSGFGAFGMGYATDAAGTWRDQLYVANEHTLSRLDTSTWQLQPVGALPSQSELTGNADGELWAFLPLEQPATIARLSKSTGQPIDLIELPGFPDPYEIDAFAFAQWGGEFWLFVRTYGLGSSTDIYRVTASGQMTLEVSDIGVDIVGAGVSTCAPAQ
jgi:hypothetical protein